MMPLTGKRAWWRKNFEVFKDFCLDKKRLRKYHKDKVYDKGYEEEEYASGHRTEKNFHRLRGVLRIAVQKVASEPEH